MAMDPKKRGSIRRSITIAIGAAVTELGKDDPDIGKLQSSLERLMDLKEEIVAADNFIVDQLISEDKDEAEINAEVDGSEQYRMDLGITMQNLKMKIKALLPTPEPSENSSTEATASTNSEQKKYKLPKIEIPKFNGDLKDWVGWWSKFKKIHDDASLHATDKFHYLSQAMVPGSEAAELVDSYPSSEGNYPEVIQALQDQYGDEDMQIDSHVRELQKLVISCAKKTETFTASSLYIKLNSHIRSLKTLGVTVKESARFLYPMVESSLTEELLQVWLRSPKYVEALANPEKNKLEPLLEFLKDESRNEKRGQMARGDNEQATPRAKPNREGQKDKDRLKNKTPATASALFSGSSNDSKCVFCDKPGHQSHECYAARRMNDDEKQKKIREKNVCFKCLKQGHGAKNCRAKLRCYICDRSHHTVLCRQKKSEPGPSKEDKQESVASSVAMKSSSGCNATILRGTVQAELVGPSRCRQVRVFVDPGSDLSYIREDLARELGLVTVGARVFDTEVFGGDSKAVSRKEHQIQLTGAKGIATIKVYTEKQICREMRPAPAGGWMKLLGQKGISLTDVHPPSLVIDVLIGSRDLPKICTGESQKVSSDIMAIESKFGWFLYGEVPEASKGYPTMASTTIVLFTRTKELTALWELDALGITESPEKLGQEEHDKAVAEKFDEGIARTNDGRYMVKLPWVCKEVSIPNNRSVAEKRLQSATRRLISKEQFDNYDEIFRKWEAEGIIQTLSAKTSDGHFLPHRPVFKPESLTTPVRPVFDASCKVGNNPSLNELLEKGPNMLELIPNAIIRFRKKDVGVLADIRKAFQMIAVDPEDCKFQKFLWWDDYKQGTMKEYQHNRVIFGMNCSPFILAAVIKHHLSHFPKYPESCKELQRSLYVDNCVTSFDSIENYKKFQSDSTEVLQQGKMDLRQWESNADDDMDKGITSVLGYKWDKHADVLYCDVPEIEKDAKVTTRSVLSIAARIFDSMGFTSPSTLQLKILLQKAWEKELGWDGDWKEEDKEAVQNWVTDMHHLALVQIPRVIVGNATSFQLHTFTDASQHAYGAVVFLRLVRNGMVEVKLLATKARVAPLNKQKGKKVTIPRLELMGLLLGSRLAASVKKSLELENLEEFYWTDSDTALSWVMKDGDWGTFVGNRVRDILKLTRKSNWRHVPGKMNPADLPSRGCSPSDLLKSKYWLGPDWLLKPEKEWPQSKPVADEELVSEERKKGTIVKLSKVEDPFPTKFNSFLKTVRVIAYRKRFARIMLQKYLNKELVMSRGPLSIQELKEAEKVLIRNVQQQYFPDVKKLPLKAEQMEDGLIHVRTKIEFKDDTECFRFPVLLPHQSPVVQSLITEMHHLHGHGGTQFLLNKLREKYWVLQGRKTVSRIIRRCVKCRKEDAKPLQVNSIALPGRRVTPGEIFSTTGVDLAGPLFLKDGKKTWIVLFTCAVYRAVVLDLVDSLSTEDFLLCLERFINLHGRPNTIYSDNGTNFVGANNLMKSMDWAKIEEACQVKMITWVFNPPAAAWWGGWWERLVRSTKSLLRRMLGKAKLTKVELATCLSAVSATLNDRPLTTLSEDLADLIPLTPAMFMRGTKMTRFPEVHHVTSTSLQERFHRVKKLQLQLQARLRKEYLATLVQRSGSKKTADPMVGDMVLVGFDNKRRYEWPLGKIVKLNKGKDGEPRSAEVKTLGGVMTRPLQRLHPLEVPTSERKDFKESSSTAPTTPSQTMPDIGNEKATPTDAPEVITRYGRKSTKPSRYGYWNF